MKAMPEIMILALLLLPACSTGVGYVPTAAEEREELLEVRDAVWHAWFDGDREALIRLVPDSVIAISAGDARWRNLADLLAGSDEFHANGGELRSLEFPRTRIQWFGSVAMVYSLYHWEFESDGATVIGDGRVTELFVREDGRWLNYGWHLHAEN